MDISDNAKALRIVGWINLVVGGLLITCGVLWTVFFRLMARAFENPDWSSGTTHIHAAEAHPDPVLAIMMNTALAATVFLGIPAFLAGFAEVRKLHSARRLAFLASIMHIVFINPMGLFFGLYSIRLLLRSRTSA